MCSDIQITFLGYMNRFTTWEHNIFEPEWPFGITSGNCLSFLKSHVLSRSSLMFPFLPSNSFVNLDIYWPIWPDLTNDLTNHTIKVQTLVFRVEVLTTAPDCVYIFNKHFIIVFRKHWSDNLQHKISVLIWSTVIHNESIITSLTCWREEGKLFKNHD